MRWLKRDIWKAGITIIGMLLLLVLMVWVPVSAAGADEIASGLAGPGTVTIQATPTEDATVSALNKEKLAQEVQQLKNQNALDVFSWLRTNAAILLSTLVVVVGGLIGLFRWFGDRRSEREKQAEERFQSAVTGLGDEKEGARIGAAILLRTFLRPGYEQFYTQTFDLAAANLRLPRTPTPPEDPNTPLPLTTLSQALFVVFKEAFPLARGQNKGSPASLDARSIQLDGAHLRKADLKQAWLPQASIREADLREADLRQANLFLANFGEEAYLSSANLGEAYLGKAYLWKADLRAANLSSANLGEAYLRQANLGDANLSGADLRVADLSRANLSGANLSRANLSEANLSRANLWKADLRVANLSEANLSEANLSRANLSEANLEDALSVQDTNLRGVEGLTKKQLEACKLRGAIIDTWT